MFNIVITPSRATRCSRAPRCGRAPARCSRVRPSGRPRRLHPPRRRRLPRPRPTRRPRCSRRRTRRTTTPCSSRRTSSPTPSTRHHRHQMPMRTTPAMSAVAQKNCPGKPVMFFCRAHCSFVGVVGRGAERSGLGSGGLGSAMAWTRPPRRRGGIVTYKLNTKTTPRPRAGPRAGGRCRPAPPRRGRDARP